LPRLYEPGNELRFVDALAEFRDVEVGHDD
jgi:hypothetical protein